VAFGQTWFVIERKMGVEEELLLVNPDTFRLEAVAHHAIETYRRQQERGGGPGPDVSSAEHLEQELFLQQLETTSAPRTRLDDVRAEVRRSRRAASQAAAAVGARVVAAGVPVLSYDGLTVTHKPRYERMVHDFGEIGRQGAVCAMHVHVDVQDDDEGVAVLDRIRPWLPILLAISANSPYWGGQDTGYASWRSQIWRRWPTAGPSEPFGDPAGYHTAVAELIRSGAAFDKGMMYFDARLSENYPTVEIRVADVCPDERDVLLIAALSRALVSTAARDWEAGLPVPAWRTDLLRAAYWRAGRDGVAHNLIDPVSREPRPAREVLRVLVDHVAQSLDETADRDAVDEFAERLLAGGAGASRQRAVHAAKGTLEAVVADLIERTAPVSDISTRAAVGRGS
jgi:carboxylate-amine ligase